MRLAEVRSFFAFDVGYQGGVSVAVGDVDGDGVAEIVAGMLGGGSEVRVFSRTGDSAVSTFTAYAPGFAGGTWVATTDVDGDKRAEMVTGAGRGGGSHVRVLDGMTGTERFGFFAYEPEFRDGVLVGGGDIDGDGVGDIVTGTGLGGGPRVRAFSGRDGTPLPAEVGNFFTYAPEFRGGCFVAAADLDADGKADLVTGAGPGGTAHVRAVRSTGGEGLASFIAYDPVALGGGFSRRAVLPSPQPLPPMGPPRVPTPPPDDPRPPAPPVFRLDQAFDTAPLGDGETTLGAVSLVGTTDPGVSVRLGARSTTSDAAGGFRFDDVMLALGNNAFRTVATGRTGLQSTYDGAVRRIDGSVAGLQEGAGLATQTLTAIDLGPDASSRKTLAFDLTTNLDPPDDGAASRDQVLVTW